MKRTWEIDENTVVVADFGFFGRKVITVNGREAHRERSLRAKKDITFRLTNRRQGLLSVRPALVGQPAFELSVDGEPMVETGKDPITCRGCSRVAKPYDRFCVGCGKAMPGAEQVQHQKQLAQATGAIKVLAVLYLVFGTIMFFVTRAQAAEGLAQLRALGPDAVLNPINGVTYTVATLTKQLLWEPWGVLLVNGILAVVMGVLALWCRRAPLAATMVAMATFVVVNVTNAIIDPATVGQGLLVKVIILAILVKGIKSALALRTDAA